MKRNTIFTTLMVAIFLLACIGDENTNQTEETNIDAEEASKTAQDTIAINVMFIEAMGKENLLRGKYEPGQSEEEFLHSVTAKNEYAELVQIKVPESSGEDSTLGDDELDKTGAIKSRSRVYNLIEYRNEDVEQPFRVSIETKVKDFETWKLLYQNEAKNRENAGMTQLQLGVAQDDPNRIYMLIAIPDIAKAREMMLHPGLKKRMVQSGVIGTPEVKFWRLAGPQSEHY